MLNYISQATINILLGTFTIFLIFFLLSLISYLAIIFLKKIEPEEVFQDENINIFLTEERPTSLCINRKKIKK